jgi:hypothetical protein
MKFRNTFVALLIMGALALIASLAYAQSAGKSPTPPPNTKPAPSPVSLVGDINQFVAIKIDRPTIELIRPPTLVFVSGTNSVTINLETGKVNIQGKVDEAAKVFWAAVSEQFPGAVQTPTTK